MIMLALKVEGGRGMRGEELLCIYLALVRNLRLKMSVRMGN